LTGRAEVIKSVPANLAYAYTLITLFSKYLLSKDEINRLIDGDDHEDVSMILTQAGLSHVVIKESDANNPFGGSQKLESQFLFEYISQSIKVVRAFSGVQRDLLMYWLRIPEISNIKTILRGKAMKHSSSLIEDQLFNLGPLSTLPIKDLLQSEDVPEVLRQLEHTRYSSFALYTQGQYEQNKDIFSLETSVDKQFFKGLIRRLNELSEQDITLIQPLVGQFIDAINVVRLLRYRVHYKLSPSHTYFLLASGGYHLKQQDLLKLVKFNDLSEIVSHLPVRLSEQLNDFLDRQQVSIHLISAFMANQMNTYAQNFLKNNTFSFSSVMAFLIIRRYQLSLIHAIVKGKKMHIKKPYIHFALGWS
jgi:V/A-type H+-transporting ATPase subunit C